MQVIHTAFLWETGKWEQHLTEETQYPRGAQSITSKHFPGAVGLCPGAQPLKMRGFERNFFFLLKEVHQERKKFHTVPCRSCFY